MANYNLERAEQAASDEEATRKINEEGERLAAARQMEEDETAALLLDVEQKRDRVESNPHLAGICQDEKQELALKSQAKRDEHARQPRPNSDPRPTPSHAEISRHLRAELVYDLLPPNDAPILTSYSRAAPGLPHAGSAGLNPGRRREVTLHTRLRAPTLTNRWPPSRPPRKKATKYESRQIQHLDKGTTAD